MANGAITADIDTGAVEKALKKLIDKSDISAKEALRAVAEDMIFNKSQDYVPVDESNLLKSGKVIEDEDGDGPSFVIEYRSEYAAAVHEMPSTFNFSRPGTGPKYLQRAIDESIGKAGAVIVDGLDRELFKK